MWSIRSLTTDHDQAARARLAQMRDEGSCREEPGVEIQVEHALPGLVISARDVATGEASQDVHHGIDAAEPGGDLVCGLRDSGAARKVCLDSGEILVREIGLLDAAGD